MRNPKPQRAPLEKHTTACCSNATFVFRIAEKMLSHSILKDKFF
jgi:hypothetical protein